MFRRKNKVEFPTDWKIGNESGHIYKSWEELPFSVYLATLEFPNDRLKILTGCTDKHLQDSKFKRKMESLTNYCLNQPSVQPKKELLLNGMFYSFPNDLKLLHQSTEQYQFIKQTLTPVYKLAEELAQENKKENPDKDKIVEISEKHALNLIKMYPSLIATYMNIANDEEFNGDFIQDSINSINDLNCLDVLGLGSFFFESSIRLMSLDNGFMTQQEYKGKVTQTTIKEQVMMIWLKCGAYIYLLGESLRNTGKRLLKFVNGRLLNS